MPCVGLDRCMIRKQCPFPQLLYETVPSRFQTSTSPDGMQQFCGHNDVRVELEAFPL
ncbi:MAG: hypothetical protein JWM17_3116 [Actinobacteria bacterium]|nr:hypothetical protein [Actinomycetota bacterium]